MLKLRPRRESNSVRAKFPPFEHSVHNCLGREPYDFRGLHVPGSHPDFCVLSENRANVSIHPSAEYSPPLAVGQLASSSFGLVDVADCDFPVVPMAEGDTVGFGFVDDVVALSYG